MGRGARRGRAQAAPGSRHDRSAVIEAALLILLIYHLVIVGVGVLIGTALTRRKLRREGLPARDRDELLRREIERAEFAGIVGPEAQARLRALYGSTIPVRDRPEAQPATAPGPTPPREVPTEPAPGASVAPPVQPLPAPATAALPTDTTPPPTRPLLPPARRARTPVQLDPALVLLYLGAFLIVAAGLIYASFNWEELEGAQKLGLLAAATAGFLAAGTALLGNTRLRPAAETFIGIGALLIPSNIIAAMTILADEPLRATITLQIGAVFATILYAFYSWRPGARVYRYATVISASIAIGVLPASLGAHRAWALPLVALAPLLVLAALGRLGRRRRWFLRPAVDTATVAGFVALVATGITGSPDGQEGLVIAAVVGAWALSLGTVATLRRTDSLGYAGLALGVGALVLALDWSGREVVRLALATGHGLTMAGLLGRGPRLYRATLADGVGAAALVGFGTALAAPGSEASSSFDASGWSVASWVAPASWWVVTAGWALVVLLRRWWPLLAAVSVIAFGAYSVTLIRLDLLSPDWTAPLWWAPAMIALVALPAWLRTHGPARDRRAQALWLWAGAGTLALGVTAWVLANMGAHEPGSRVLAVASLTGFAVAAVVAAQQHHRGAVLALAAGWTIGAIAVALDPLPVADVYRSPVIAGALGAAGLALPLAAGRPWWRRRRSLVLPQIVFGLAALVAASPMLGRAVDLIGGAVDAADAAWWPWYAAMLGATALVTGWASRRQHPNVLTAASALGGIVAGGLLLRAAYDATDPDPLLWPPTGIALGLLVGMLAMLIADARLDGARRWAGWTAIGAGLILLPAAVTAVTRSVAYIASGFIDDIPVPHMDAPAWWAPMLVAFMATAAVSHLIGVRRDLAALSVVTLASADLAVALAMRMVTTDLFAWSVAGMVFGGAALVAVLLLRRVAPERRYLSSLGQIMRLMPLVGVAGLVANIAGGLEGSIDPIRNVALYGIVAVVVAAASVRLRAPTLVYGSAAAFALAIVFLLLVDDVDPLDALLAPAVAAWVLVGISLAPRLAEAWARPLERSGYGLGAIPIAFGLADGGPAWQIDSDVYQRVTLSIMSLALVLALAAFARRDPLRGTAAVGLAAAAALRQVATLEPESWQPYAGTLAVALWALGMLWHRWPARSNPAYGLAGAVLIGVPFIESFTIGDTTDAFIAGACGIAVVVLGLAVRRQAPVAVGVVGVTLVVLRQLVDAAMAFESWQVLGIAGAALVIGGTIILAVRDTLRQWLDSGTTFWRSLG